MKGILAICGLFVLIVAASVFAAGNEKAEVNDAKNMTYGNCVSEMAKIKNGCYATIKDQKQTCTQTAKNATKVEMKACKDTYKKDMMQCKSGFKMQKKECAKIKHNVFQTMGSSFK